MKAEGWARFLVVFLVSAAATVVGVGWLARPEVPLLRARMAEAGGWTPDNLNAVAGEPLHLRLTSEDVLHSFAVGQSDLPPVDVLPGEISEVSLTFDRPGKYVFYCTRWCGLNHWRMRGVIEVSGPAEVAEKIETPLYLRRGLDLDAPRSLGVPAPAVKPAPQSSSLTPPPELLDRDTYLTRSPADVFETLKAEPGLSELPDQEIWNLVAKIWKSQTPDPSLQNGKRLYATNCAACHGEQGQGDGVFAAELTRTDHPGMEKGEMTQAPADFTDPAQMLSASSALLQGKIIRGGMGTGMPYWGPVFTEEETWDLVAYLWSFQFELEEHK